MEILIAGKVSSISAPFCEKLGVQHKLVVASNHISSSIIGRVPTPYQMSPEDKSFAKLFNSHSFGAVLYFSQRPEIQTDDCNDLQELESVLRLCTDNDVGKLIYISSTSVYAGLDMADEYTAPVPVNSTGVVLAACEQLCDFYRDKGSMDILVLHTPCTYGYGESTSVVGDIIAQAVQNASVRFHGTEHQLCDFLSQEDLAEFLVRVLDNWPKGYSTINLPGAASITFGALGEALRNILPTLRISYTGQRAVIAPPIPSSIARKEYDWVALLVLTSELNRLLTTYRVATKPPKQSIFHRGRDFIAKYPVVIRVVELVVGFLLMELLNQLTRTSIQFQYIDFRLLYVVLLGTLHGLKTGVGASVFACISLLISHIASGTDWRILAYNVDNWLPFACFLLIGAITGYTKDKLRNDLAYTKQEKDELEQRYIFLNELYAGALQNKSQFKTQIMSYRDSFGKIFDVTKKLDSMLPDEIFKEALTSMEDILENQSICIYLVDPKSNFGRLMVCSKMISPSTPKSINLSNYTLMTEAFSEGEVWSNTDRFLGYPEYAAPIFRGSDVVALITIQKARFEQMAIYYKNLIRVLCGLVQVSLIRAAEFNEHTQNEIYLPGTRIMKPERFRQVLELKDKMQEEAVSEYSIVHVAAGSNDVAVIGNQISKRLRNTDVIGLGGDGELYIVLSQTTEENIGVVLDRLRNNGIALAYVGSQSE